MSLLPANVNRGITSEQKKMVKIISKVGNVFIFYHIVVSDMLDFKNSI